MTERRQLITQGEQAVSDDPNLVVSTLLGSCVSCCLWDPIARVGGINHMLVTRLSDSRVATNMAGGNAMELLINEIQKNGGARGRLLAKVFGGARMVKGLSDIGAGNAAFTLNFLEQEGMHCVSKSIGGDQARQLMFWPATGAARQKCVPNTQSPTDENVQTPPEGSGNAMELF